jgi:hypothetical protein
MEPKEIKRSEQHFKAYLRYLRNREGINFNIDVMEPALQTYKEALVRGEFLEIKPVDLLQLLAPKKKSNGR